MIYCCINLATRHSISCFLRLKTSINCCVDSLHLSLIDFDFVLYSFYSTLTKLNYSEDGTTNKHTPVCSIVLSGYC